MIKEIINESDGTPIEAKILKKIQQHIFMLYPMSGIRAALLSVVNEKGYREGIYIYLIGNSIDFLMRIPEKCLIRTIAYPTYDPFFEEAIGAQLKRYVKRDEKLKNAHSKATDLKNKGDKIIFKIIFKSEKSNPLKRFLEGLGL